MPNATESLNEDLTKDQLYHAHHREERWANAHQYYVNTLKSRCQRLRKDSKADEESVCTYNVGDVAREVTDLETKVAEWKNFWGPQDWKLLGGIIPEEELKQHHCTGIALRTRLKSVFRSHGLENEPGQIQAVYHRCFDLNTELIQGLLELDWFSVAGEH
ncbi:hypothetical protein C8J56DRAFT_880150 [Mycena floridula]|nr:hypothetical protein C8J56DRAFT_880150 [Mycena floridula]